jgi:hypothetical protein
MRRFLSTLTVALLTSSTLHAGGLTEIVDDPEVTAPAIRDEWTGPYIGLAYGRADRTETTEKIECFKLGQPKACDDPIFDYYPEYKVQVATQTTTETSEDLSGAFIGYRKTLGWRAVGGLEIGQLGDVTMGEAQIGLDAGRVLPYGFAGYSSEGTIYGIGADVRVGKNLLVGAKLIDGDFQATVVRVGIKF